MTDNDSARLERLEQLMLELAPTINALGSILVRQSAATREMGLNKNTIAANDKIPKFEEIGKRKTFIEIGSVNVVKARKSTRKASR